MSNIPGLVSIVIPAYNAGHFLKETIQSLLGQTYIHWECFVVNDGSTDDTATITASFNDPRIRLINQDNAGVSVARNTGMDSARGEFIVFFDADDVMTPDFLEIRIDALQKNPGIGFVGGLVETFPNKTRNRKAVAKDPEREIHFFDITVATIPSNYLFRLNIIRAHSIRFNTILSSSADRFFLLEVARHAKGLPLETEKGKLLYRISEWSMSHHVTPKLTQDYYRYYKELNARGLLPVKNRREIKTRYLFSIASSYSLIRHWGSCLKLLFRSFFTHPIVFFRLATDKSFRNTN